MKKRLLHIVDNINYLGGVPKATALQANSLADDFDVTVFSIERPNDKVKSWFSAAAFMDLDDDFFKTLTISFAEAIKSSEVKLRHKLLRIVFSAAIRSGLSDAFIGILLSKKLFGVFDSFEAVCVSGQDSLFRGLVASLNKPRKIQWFHIDYCVWSEYDSRTRAIAKGDLKRYLEFDKIICHSENIAQSFAAKMPRIAEKAVVIPNFIDFENINRMADMPADVKIGGDVLNI